MSAATAAWLKKNKGKFDVWNDASGPFIDYTPHNVILYRGKPIYMLSVKLSESGGVQVYNDNGDRINTKHPGKRFTFTDQPNPYNS